MVKRYFRYIFLGLSLFCIARILEQNSIKLSLQALQPSSYILLFLALVITLCAHTWSAYVWYIILRSFRIKNLDLSGILSLYLVSNIYKYVPGNIGHFYLRITYLTKAGYPLDLAGVSVLLEPILMALAALWLGLVCIVSSLLAKIGLGILGMISISFLIQPRILNHFFKRNQHELPYLLIPLIGEIIFILIRGGGFLLTATAVGLALLV
jgi:glycosyltransferase 2 family protein